MNQCQPGTEGIEEERYVKDDDPGFRQEPLDERKRSVIVAGKEARYVRIEETNCQDGEEYGDKQLYIFDDGFTRHALDQQQVVQPDADRKHNGIFLGGEG
ncbi:hypothetical protein ES708_33877 [subsurface metagenome]